MQDLCFPKALLRAEMSLQQQLSSWQSVLPTKSFATSKKHVILSASSKFALARARMSDLELPEVNPSIPPDSRLCRPLWFKLAGEFGNCRCSKF